jgi:hypothetical protein
LSARPTEAPDGPGARAALFLAYLCKDDRWAGEGVLAEVLRALYEAWEARRRLDPISWKWIAIELRKLLIEKPTYQNVKIDGKDRKRQAYRLPDAR